MLSARGAGRFFTFGLNHCGGLTLRWWRDQFAAAEVAAAHAKGQDPYQVIDERMPEAPAPVWFLPHLNGSGTPTCDLASRGAILGLTLATTRHQVAKALLEGLCFELRANLEALTSAGIQLEALVAVGGGSRSARWLQLKADVLNRPIQTVRCDDAACLGAALLAGTASGLYASAQEAVQRAVSRARIFLPDPRRTDLYQQRWEVYRRLHPTLRALNLTEGSP